MKIAFKNKERIPKGHCILFGWSIDFQYLNPAMAPGMMGYKVIERKLVVTFFGVDFVFKLPQKVIK